MTDLKPKLMNAIKTGDVALGANGVIDALLNRETRYVIVAHNCPPEIRERITYYCQLADTPHLAIKSDALALGAICARPHPVAALAITDPGESDILDEIQTM